MFLRPAYYGGKQRTGRPGSRVKEIGFDGVNAGFLVFVGILLWGFGRVAIIEIGRWAKVNIDAARAGRIDLHPNDVRNRNRNAAGKMRTRRAKRSRARDLGATQSGEHLAESVLSPCRARGEFAQSPWRVRGEPV